MRRAPARLIVLAVIGMSCAPLQAAGPDYAVIEQAITAGRLVQARAMLASTSPAEAAADPTRLQGLAAALALAERRDRSAHAMFTALLAHDPASCVFLRGAGVSALRLGDHLGAIPFLERAITTCPASSESFSWLATAYDRAKRWAESAAMFDKALALEPDNPGILNNRGYSLIRQRQFEKALPLLERAHALAPANVRIANNLDIVLAATGNPLPAREGSDDALSADRLNNAGYAAYLAGRLEAARAYLSKAMLESDVYSPRIAANLALVEAELGGD